MATATIIILIKATYKNKKGVIALKRAFFKKLRGKCKQIEVTTKLRLMTTMDYLVVTPMGLVIILMRTGSVSTLSLHFGMDHVPQT